MEKLNRQILGSENWGSSVNANWGKIERGIGDVQGQIEDIKKQIEIEYGVMFGGFIRFDAFEGSELTETPTTIYITDSAEMHYTEGKEFDVGDATHKSTVPVNRMYRIIGNWTPLASLTSSQNTSLNLFDLTWADGNMCMYTSAGYRQVFWNNHIYIPTAVLEDGSLQWDYVEDTKRPSVTTSFPQNMIAAVSYNYFINRIPITNKKRKQQIAVPYTLEGLCLTAYADIKFYNKDENGFITPIYAHWSIETETKTVSGVNTTLYYLVVDAEDVFDDGDYAVVTYFNKEQDKITQQLEDVLVTEV